MSAKIGLVDKVYNSGNAATLKWHSVKFPEFRLYAKALSWFLGALGEATRNDEWQPIIKKLKRFRFDVCASPLAEELLTNRLSSMTLSLSGIDEYCRLVYPNAHRTFTTLIEQIDRLTSVRKDRMLFELHALVHAKKIDPLNSALLILEPRLVADVEQSLLTIPALVHIPIVTPSLLRETTCYQKIIIFGPTSWFWQRKYVFTAPRATHLLIMKYSWVIDQWIQENAFAEPVKQRSTKKLTVVKSTVEEEDIPAEDLLPESLDIAKVINKAREDARASGESDYTVDARLFLFEDNWFVFLEADESATVEIIDLESDRLRPIKRVRMAEVIPGVFILLRTGGGGDYVVPVANRIMGDDAAIAREFQKEWKKLLRQKLKRSSYIDVMNQLIALGSIRASPQNIRNWISERSIKTDDFTDFNAIMQFVELGKEANYYWEMMGKIDRAHLKAGMQIRRMLLDQVEKCDLGKLKRAGRMEFTLPGEDKISITAFQVRDISPQVVPVSPFRIGYPFELDE
jgi:hypothetical protein